MGIECVQGGHSGLMAFIFVHPYLCCKILQAKVSDMKKELTLAEYRSLAYTLRRIKPLGTCCGNTLLETIRVEPLAGRAKAQVKRTCIVQCPECKTKFVSPWD